MDKEQAFAFIAEQKTAFLSIGDFREKRKGS